KLGLGLAVFILLSRYDDHVAYYTLERNFLERHGVVIPRQQMVQWVEKIAHLLLVAATGTATDAQAHRLPDALEAEISPGAAGVGERGPVVHSQDSGPLPD
ncbi:MAG: hypothetical protein GY764_12535, partial [Halieaceae bacterium]|nr:hypothetical protein [Halieaceae bacterium]